MAKRTSMEDLAKKLGISKNTVSLALRGRPGISGKTRRQILEAAKQYGYEYKPAVARVSGNICLILPKSIRNSIEFFGHIQYGIEDEAKRNSLNSILYYYDEDGRDFETPLCIKDGMISGIITLGRISAGTIAAVEKYSLPTVMVDTYMENAPLDCILTDNLCGGYVATEHLILCGHEKIGFIGDITRSVSFYDRYQGYRKALMSYNLPIEEAYILDGTSLEDLANEDINLACTELRRLKSIPTAFFCCNDAEAVAAFKAFPLLGYKIPEDISIIGFDDIDSAKTLTPELTTLRVEKEWMGKIAVQQLLARTGDPEAPCRKVLLSAGLVQRQSVRKM
jgi:LacI family transcriptional regulator